MHKVTGRWKLGLTLALTTAVCWGVLPIALKLALKDLDAYTITWFRFAVAAAVLGAVLAFTGGWPPVRTLGSRVWRVLLVALMGLIINYVLYLLSLNYTTPAISQVVIQLGPMFFLLGGLALFRERFSPWQWAGFALLVLGLLLFFNRRLPELVDLSSGTGIGVVLIVVSALAWATYALAQKQLLAQLRSQQILLLIYIGAVAISLPLTHLEAVFEMRALPAWMLAFSCANTLIAYGAFAEALEHWEASRVGAVLAITPLFTLLGVWLVGHLAPGLLEPERLNLLSVAGALLVVAGSILCVLGKSSPRTEERDLAMLE